MKIKQLALTLFSSMLMALAIHNELFPYGCVLLTLIALVPLFIALHGCASHRYASLLGLIYAMTNSFATYFWLLFFQDFSVWTCTGVALGHSLYMVLLFPVFSRLLKTGGVYRSVLIAGAWVAYEYIKSIGYIGFPWGLIAYPLEKILPFMQIADITGLWAVSFLAALVNGNIADLIISLRADVLPKASCRKYRKGGMDFRADLLSNWIFLLLLTAGTLGYGIYQLGREIPYKTTLKVVLVQQNADSWVHGLEMPSIIKGQNLTREGIREIDPDLVIWSENAFREPYYKRSFSRRPKEDPFVPFLAETGAPVLVGSPIVLNWERLEAMNGAILIAPDGEVMETYGKQHPVPIAEHIPFWEVPFIRNFFENIVGLSTAGWTMGTRYTLFEITNEEGVIISFGVPICFEDAFAKLNRNFILLGADLLVNITNDSWSRTVSAETQHFAAARFRAVEARRVLIRSTNAGVTTIIDPHGRMVKTLPLFVEGVLTAEVPVYRDEEPTAYLLYGDWFPWMLILSCVAFLLYIRIKKDRDDPAFQTGG